jgi:hypothetical protein
VTRDFVVVVVVAVVVVAVVVVVACLVQSVQRNVVFQRFQWASRELSLHCAAALFSEFD